MRRSEKPRSCTCCLKGKESASFAAISSKASDLAVIDTWPRLRATGVVEVQNPVAQAIQEGRFERFEDLDD